MTDNMIPDSKDLSSPREPEAGWLAAIPANVRYHDKLTPNAKLLYAEITALCKREGYCWASNDYFAKAFKFTDRTIRTLIAQLDELGFIQVEIIRRGNGHGEQMRRIYIDVDVLEVLRSGRNFPSLRKRFSAAAEEIFRSNIDDYNKISIHPISPPPGGKCGKEDFEPDRFDRFWKYYKGLVPKGVPLGDKQRAKSAWNKLRPDAAMRKAMLDGLTEQANNDRWKRGIGISHVSTWLNGRKWETSGETGEAGDDPNEPAEEGYGWN